MDIREATENDIPIIVNLLRLSLGETLMPKSESFWRWKHVDNPFGKSQVLLGFENGELVGVRAFMRWNWSLNGNVIRAVRAVDTATHPDFQGRGIFKKLTLNLVDHCEAEGIDFIFNTPNTQSMPGYLKMGWSLNGRMGIHIRPVFSIRRRNSEFRQRYLLADAPVAQMDFSSHTPSAMVTLKSPGFILWRYAQIPNITYQVFYDPDSNPKYLTIFRLKPFRGGVELRVCESLFKSGYRSRQYRKHLMMVAQEAGANVITSAQAFDFISFPSLPLGPKITTFPLSLQKEKLHFRNWRPTLGDMEVF